MKRIWIAVAGALFPAGNKVVSVVASALVLLGIALLILGLVKPTSPVVPVRAGEFEDSIPQKRVRELISLAFPEGLQVAGAKAPFEVIHQSLEQAADFSFNALGSVWKVELPEGDEVSFEVRFKAEGGGWTEWQKVEEEDDLKEDPPPGTHYGRLISAGDAQYFQYRAVFTLTSAQEIPSVPKIKLTYIDSRGQAKPKGRSIGAVFNDAILAVRHLLAPRGYEVSANAPSADVSVISRANWGADESYRVDAGGNEIWTRSYQRIEKMIVHHTVFNDPDPKAVVRAIYYYHAVTLGFGDIGYNFLVDRSGNIYEGRYGGDAVVAGHARRYNWGSVGVAVLGDFRYDTTNNPIRNTLDKIAVWKFTKHGVDPILDTYFIDRVLPPVFGHGEVLATLCPGTNLQNYVPALRSHARYMPQEVVVKFKGGVSEGEITSFTSRLRLEEVSRHGFNTRRYRFGSDRTVGEIAAIAWAEGVVEWAWPNHIRQMTLTPDDPEFVNQWNLTQIKAPEAWDISPGGDPTVTIAVLDTGVAYENYSDARGIYAQATDFGGTTFIPGYDFVNNDTHANDDHGHGTAVASIIAATTNNSVGIAGIAYAAKVMPVKVLDENGAGTDLTVADGIRWAVDNGAKVLNLSLAGFDYSPAMHDAVRYARDVKGAVVVVAAGNSGRGTLMYPAAYTEVIAVGASDLVGNRTYYSNYGTNLDLLAPGGDLKADLDGNGTKDGILFETLDIKNPRDFTQFKFALGHGTSFATPHVAAAAAIMVTRGTIWPKSVARYLVFTRGSNGVLQSDSAIGFATNVPPYPDGVLLHAPSRHQVYYLEGGRKHWIPSPEIFVTRFKWEDILIVDEYTLDIYSDGENYRFADGTLLKGSDHPVYVMSGGQKRWIVSPEIFNALGYNWGRILAVSDAPLASYPTGPNLDTPTYPEGALIWSPNDHPVYLVSGGQKRWIPSPEIFSQRFVRWDYILTTTQNQVAALATGENALFEGGVLVKGSGHQVYLISNGQKRWIVSPLTFNDLGFNWGKIILLPDSHLDRYLTGATIY